MIKHTIRETLAVRWQRCLTRLFLDIKKTKNK